MTKSAERVSKTKILKIGPKDRNRLIYNGDIRIKMARFIREGASKRDAALLAGVQPETLSRWLAKHEELDQEMAWAEAANRHRTIKQLYKHGKKNWQPLSWLLERIHPQQYGQRTGLLIGGGGVVIQVLGGGYVPPKLSYDKLKAITGKVVENETPTVPK